MIDRKEELWLNVPKHMLLTLGVFAAPVFCWIAGKDCSPWYVFLIAYVVINVVLNGTIWITITCVNRKARKDKEM